MSAARLKWYQANSQKFPADDTLETCQQSRAPVTHHIVIPGSGYKSFDLRGHQNGSGTGIARKRVKQEEALLCHQSLPFLSY